MQILEHEIGVCSWSLRPRDVAELTGTVKQLGLTRVQLALNPLLDADDERRTQQLAQLTESGLTIQTGMIGFAGEDYSSIATIRKTGGYLPDEQWEARLALTGRAIDLAASMKLSQISTHIGFVPHSADPGYRVMVDRVGQIAQAMAEKSIDLLLETGQEAASELLQFLNDVRCRSVYANFDPANMILYGAGDPIDAVHTLRDRIRHVHVKDAIMSDQPRVKWGTEVPFGMGQVGPERFIKALKDVGYTGPLVIEREAGPERVRDVQFAIESLQRAAAKLMI
jgi:L-ribulose-5-phosphate 3-epimerase